MPRRGRSEQPEDDIRLEESPVDTNLDPHLQHVLMRTPDNETLEAAFAEESPSGELLIDVIAKLDKPDADVPGLNVVRKMGQIVTGTVAVQNVEAVRRHANVLSLKRATELRQELQFSVHQIGATPDQLAAVVAPGLTLDGRGVVVGVVDIGCDFVHRNFRNPDGTTRLLSLWDQRGGATSLSPAGFGYGRELDSAALNQALRKAAPSVPGAPEDPPAAYREVAYEPSVAAHGTHVFDIAAGNGLATGNPGVAPGATLIFVHVAPSDVGDEESVGNSRRLLEAVDYVFGKAAALDMPAVVNVSLGTHGGPHDGSTLVEQGFDALLSEPNRMIVVAAGNSRLRRSHVAGDVSVGQPREITWQITAGDLTANELEVWYPGDQELTVTLISPAGSRLGPVRVDTTREIKNREQRVGRIIHRLHDPNNGDNQIDILLDSSLPAGDWKVLLETASGEPVSFHAWIERDDKGQSRFAEADASSGFTIGSISCGRGTLVVGAYDGTAPSRDPSAFSSEGPTRDGRFKPEISAPGQSVRAAKSLSQGAIAKSGTSMAAPHVTGAFALLAQAAGRSLTLAEIRAYLTGQPQPEQGAAWNARGGFTQLNCVAAIGSVTGIVPVESALAPAGAGPVGERELSAPTAMSNGRTVTPFDELLRALSMAANSGHARIRVQIDVEPVSEPV